MILQLEIISAIIGVIGAVLNIKKMKSGFIVWIIGNILWIIYGLTTKQYFFMSQYIIFALISFLGFSEWHKSDKNKSVKIKK